MREIVLPRSTEKPGAIDFGDIQHRHLLPVPHDGELTQAREKGLDMVGNADTEGIVNGVCHAVLEAVLHVEENLLIVVESVPCFNQPSMVCAYVLPLIEEDARQVIFGFPFGEDTAGNTRLLALTI